MSSDKSKESTRDDSESTSNDEREEEEEEEGERKSVSGSGRGRSKRSKRSQSRKSRRGRRLSASSEEDGDAEYSRHRGRGRSRHNSHSQHHRHSGGHSLAGDIVIGAPLRPSLWSRLGSTLFSFGLGSIFILVVLAVSSYLGYLPPINRGPWGGDIRNGPSSNEDPGHTIFPVRGGTETLGKVNHPDPGVSDSGVGPDGSGVRWSDWAAIESMMSGQFDFPERTSLREDNKPVSINRMSDAEIEDMLNSDDRIIYAMFEYLIRHQNITSIAHHNFKSDTPLPIVIVADKEDSESSYVVYDTIDEVRKKTLIRFWRLKRFDILINPCVLGNSKRKELKVFDIGNLGCLYCDKVPKKGSKSLLVEYTAVICKHGIGCKLDRVEHWFTGIQAASLEGIMEKFRQEPDLCD